jgi:hypothetical protein
MQLPHDEERHIVAPTFYLLALTPQSSRVSLMPVSLVILPRHRGGSLLSPAF